MKTAYVFVTLLFVTGCSKSTSTETSSTETASDSTLQTDSSVYQSDDAAEQYASEEETNVGGEPDIEMYFDEASHVIMDGEESFYQVSIVSNGYESSSDITWYFDKEFGIRCYKQSWSMEGQEGSEEFYLRNDSVVCVLEIESGGMGTTTTRVCIEVGGQKTIENYEQTPVNEPVPVSYMNTQRKKIDGYMDSLRGFLSGLEIPDPEAETYEFKIENVVDVGQEVTETTTITIPKALYEKLMN